MKKSCHPGVILQQNVIKPLDISAYRLAKLLGVSGSKINEIILGNRSISVDTALRLERLLGTPASDWMMLQMDYDLEIAKKQLKGTIEKSVQPIEKAPRKANNFPKK